MSGFALYRTLWPLVATDFKEHAQIVGGRTRAAIEREKTLVLRSIKELEFDRAMGKVSDTDFDLMGRRLRAQALTLMKQLDVDLPGYRDVIERELAQRLAIDPQRDDIQTDRVPETDRPVCASCGTENDTDAKFVRVVPHPWGEPNELPRVSRLLVSLMALTMLWGATGATDVAGQPDPRQMSGLPLPDPGLPDGTVTVRVIRGQIANNVPDQLVELRQGDSVERREPTVRGARPFSH